MTELRVMGDERCASRIVVLGGSFDPVHAAHIILVRRAMKALRADLGAFVVDEAACHRDTVAPFLERRRMVRLALAREPSVREAGDIMSLARSLVDAVNLLADAGHEVHAVFGSDSARKLDCWDGRRQLVRARLWAVPRIGDPGDVPDGVGLLPIRVPAWSATGIRLAAASGVRTPSGVPAICRAHVQRVYGGNVTNGSARSA